MVCLGGSKVDRIEHFSKKYEIFSFQELNFSHIVIDSLLLIDLENYFFLLIFKMEIAI